MWQIESKNLTQIFTISQIYYFPQIMICCPAEIAEIAEMASPSPAA